VGNTKTAIYDYLIPVFTAFFAYFFLDERITAQQAAGAVIIFVGVYMARLGYKRFIPRNERI